MAMSRMQRDEARARMELELDVMRKSLIKANEEIVQQYDLLKQLRELLGIGPSKVAELKERRSKLAMRVFTGNDQRLNAWAIIPEELWEMILALLPNPRDVINFSETCQLFQTLYSPKQMNTLFSLVFDTLRPGLTKSNISVLRTTCKAWKLIVDNELSNHNAILPIRNASWNLENEQPRFYKSTSVMIDEGVTMIYHFKNTLAKYQEPGNLMRQLEASHQEEINNPFISRAVYLHFFAYAEVEEFYDGEAGRQLGLRERDAIFWEGLISLLAKYGRHVTSLQIHVTRFFQHADISMIRRFIQTILPRFFPNLKYLRLGGFITFYPSYFVFPHETFPQLERFEYHYDEQPVHNNWIFEDVLQWQARRAGQNNVESTLKSLLHTWIGWSQWGIYTRNWSNLVELELVDVRGMMSSQFLANARLPKLKKLGIKPYSNRRFATGYTYAGVMDIMNCLSRTTKINTLLIREGFSANQVEGVGMCDEFLINLEIEHVKGQNFLDAGKYNFLIKMPFLQNLRLFWVKPSMDSERYNFFNRGEPDYNSLLDITDLNKLISGSMTAYECSVWGLLPKLKTLTIQDHVYDRISYNQYVKKQSTN